MVKGSFEPSDTILNHLSPVFRYPWLSQPTSRSRAYSTAAPFAAEVVLADGSLVRVPFDARPGDDSAKSTGEFGAFTVTIPVSGEVKTLRITDAAGVIEYGRRDRSEVAPIVVFESPRQGARLTRQSRVKWSVDDPDTDPADLVFQLAFSPDNGRSFVPVAVGLRELQAEFDATELPPATLRPGVAGSSKSSKGTGMLRVFVSDGLNTAYADVRGLSTPVVTRLQDSKPKSVKP